MLIKRKRYARKKTKDFKRFQHGYKNKWIEDISKAYSNRKWNDDKCQRECENPKEHHFWEKDDIWNPATCSCRNGKYLACVTNDSVIRCDENKETTKTVPTNFNEKM